MIALSGGDLDLESLCALAEGAGAELTADARARAEDGAARLQALIADGTPIYGVTTGFGALDARGVSPERNAAQQANLLRSHAAGVGEPMARGSVRAMMAVRANVLATGITGVRAATLDALLAMLNADVVPEVPRVGSVGACGDLAPLAHMALALIGEGRASHEGGAWQPAADALQAAGLAPVDLSGRDGIALINGTEQTTADGALAWLDAARLTVASEAVAALTMDAVGSLDDSFDARVALAKGHPGQRASAAALRAFTDGSQGVSAPHASRLRDALSLRCVSQVAGAARDALAHVRAVLEREINAGNDNPIFDRADGWVTSNSGNFHGQAAAEALDYLANAVTSLAVMSERRAARLVDEGHNGGLPAFLIHPDARQGENSGFMIAQYTAAALVARLRMRAVPASIQSIPTCANTEDHVPMGPLAGERAAFAVETLRRVLAVELLLAAQGLDIRGRAPAPALAPLYEALRARVPTMVTDRVMSADIAAATAVLADRPLLRSLADSSGEPLTTS